MDAINLDILKQLQEYAQMYFNAIVEANTTCGKCKFADGKYTAKDVTKWIYALPCDDIFNEDIILESGTFRCKFPYRRIFEVLSDWETMCRAGKLKTVFEIGETETKSAKVLIQEKTALGAFKFKSMKLQRIAGNWWREVKEIRKNKGYRGYYELNGVMFQGGGKMFFREPEHESTVNFCKNHGDDEMKTAIFNYIAQNPGNEFCAYYSEVLTRAGIHIETEETATIMEAAKEEKRKREEKKAAVSAKKPIWKQANELAGEYDKRGYQFVYNERTKLCYLTIPGHIFVDGSQCTTELTYVMTGKIDDFRDIPKAVGEYNAMYCAKYAEKCPQMLAYLPTEPREAGIGREPQGQEAKCRLAPSWVANRVLPHGFRVLCFSSYPNGDFSISVENKEGCRILTKDEFRKLCSEPPQSPEIPQETAEPANVSAEEGNEAIKHISEIMETCRTWDNEKRDYTDEYKYYTWLANHIPEHENTNKNVTEIVLEEVRERIATAATLVAHGVPKCDMEGAVCAVVNRLAKMEDILRFYDAIEPPQSPTTSTDIQTIKPQEKRAQTARKEPKRTIKIFLQVQRPAYHFREVTKMVVPRLVRNVPRGCFTAVMPHGSPPIRGDCAIINFLTKQSTRYG